MRHATCLSPAIYPVHLQDLLGAAHGALSRPAGKVLVQGSSLAAQAAGTGARVAAQAAGGGARAAAAVLTTGVGVASKAAASPHRVIRGLHRVARSETNISSAAAGTPGTIAGLDASGADAGGLSSSLMRVHSSPDGSLLPMLPTEAVPAADGGGSVPSSPKVAARSLLRQSSNIAAAVLSRLSRSSSPGIIGRQQSGHSSVPAAGGPAEQPQNQQRQRQSDTPDAAAAGAAGTGASTALSDAEQRMQRERRLHEQALAELVVLAGPASAMRPPELPSAAGAAEAAEQRLQEQLALFQHRRRNSLPASQLAELAAAVGNSVFRTSTAPPTMSDLLRNIAAEQPQQPQQPHLELGQEQEQALPLSPRRTVQRLSPLPSAGGLELDPAFAGGHEEGPATSKQPEAEGAVPAQEAGGAAEAVEPPGTRGASAAAEPGSHRPSMLQRLMSVAGAPWRGRSVSSTAEAPRKSDGGADGSTPQASAVSMLSTGSLAPWTASLAELSSECGGRGGSLPVCLAVCRLLGSSASNSGAETPADRMPLYCCRRSGPAHQHHQPGHEPAQRQPPVWAPQPPPAAVQRRLVSKCGSAGQRGQPAAAVSSRSIWRGWFGTPATVIILCFSAAALFG